MPAAPFVLASAGSGRSRFLSAALGAAAVVVACGWWSGLRTAFHAVLLALSVAAFLPLLVIAAFVLLFVGLSVAGILVGESEAAPHAADAFAASEGVGAFSRRVLIPYYRLWFVRRHPLLLGAATGLLVGALVLGGLLALYVVPGEVCTLKRMGTLQSAIEDYHHHHAGYPAAVGADGVDLGLVAGHDSGWPFCAAPPGSERGADRIVLDGFGRPLQYEVSGAWPFAGYRLRSLGYDGRPGRDDLCLDGRSRGRAAIERVADAVRAIHDLLGDSSGSAGQSGWWSALRSSACPSDARSKD